MCHMTNDDCGSADVRRLRLPPGPAERELVAPCVFVCVLLPVMRHNESLMQKIPKGATREHLQMIWIIKRVFLLFLFVVFSFSTCSDV